MERKPAKDFQDLIVWQKAHHPHPCPPPLRGRARVGVFWILAPDFWILSVLTLLLTGEDFTKIETVNITTGIKTGNNGSFQL